MSHSDPLTHLTRRAMATEFAVLLPESDKHMTELALDALSLVDEIEQRLSVYQPESEISVVNREASDHPVRVSPATFRLLERAIDWSRKSDGAFDITAGPLIQLWGFSDRRGQKPSDDAIAETLRSVGYGKLALDKDSQSIEFLAEGMSINLGAIGKGDALDRIAEHLRANGCSNFLVHGGQSSVIASGSQFPEDDFAQPSQSLAADETTDRRSGSRNLESENPSVENPSVENPNVENSGGWRIGVSHPTKNQRRLGGVVLRDAALSTSGSGKQFFHYKGQRYGHVFDPRTGYPAGDSLSLTVICEQAVDADAASTGLFVSSLDEMNVVSQATGMPMISIRAGRRQDEVEVTSIGAVPWIEKAAQ